MQRHTVEALNQIFTIASDVTLVKEIAQGTNGAVISAKNSTTGEMCAVKKLPRVTSGKLMKQCLREIKFLRHFRHHANITCLYDVDIILAPNGDVEELYIYEELMETTLKAIIRSGQHLTDDHVQSFIYSILCGLKYIHSANVLHRDLWPGNILLNEDCTLKICDFGGARGYTPGPEAPDAKAIIDFVTEAIVTRWYRAPEIMLSLSNYTSAIDVWSVGCIFAEMLGGKPIFKGRDYVDQLNQILYYLGTPSEDILSRVGSPRAQQYITSLPVKSPIPFQNLYPTANPLAIDLLTKMLTFDPAKRISCEDALRHPYLEVWYDPDDQPSCNVAFDSSFESEDNEGLKNTLVKEVELIHLEVRTNGDRLGAFFVGEQAKSEISLPNSVEPKGSAEGSPEKKGDESSPQTLPQSVIPTESELEVTSSHLGTVSAEIGLNDKDTDHFLVAVPSQESPSNSSLSRETTRPEARGDMTAHDLPRPYAERLEALLASVKVLLSRGVPAYTAVDRLPTQNMYMCVQQAREISGCRDQLLALREIDAQIMLCIIQSVLDRLSRASTGSGGISDDGLPQERRQLLRLLVQLAEHSNQLPPSLFVTGITLLGSEPIAMGGFADVFHGTLGTEAVALKRLRVVATETRRAAINREICREALMWTQLKHRFILSFLGIDLETFARIGAACLVSPWMARGSILFYLTEGNSVLAERERLVAELADGLAYVHSYGINHGDVRGTNVFVDDNCHAVLADFGLSVVDNVTGRGMLTTTNKNGSVRWMAPELHDPEHFELDHFERTQETDVYSFGCTVLEIYTLKAPFANVRNDVTVAMRILGGERPRLPSAEECGGRAMPEIVWEIVRQCWHQDRALRPTMKAVHALMPHVTT